MPLLAPSCYCYLKVAIEFDAEKGGETMSGHYCQQPFPWVNCTYILWSAGHPCCISMLLCQYTWVFFPCISSISAQPCMKCNLTSILSGNALVDTGCHQHRCYPSNLGDRPWEPQYRNKYQAYVFKAIKSLQYAAYVCTHLSDAYASLSTLLAVAVEMKYWPPESHLAPNWAILLLFSPFRLWLSLLQSDGWKLV